jgi:hypothetical protein
MKKEEAFVPSRTNLESPAPGMGAVDTNSFDELETKTGAERDELPAEEKEIEREEEKD